MPPRFAYWTILAGGLPTAFRAADRDDLMPTFQRLREKHPDAEMKWFARGKLWNSPEEARRRNDGPMGQTANAPGNRGFGPRKDQRRPMTAEGSRGSSPKNREDTPRAGGGQETRGRDWRPGGAHRDPRQKYVDAKKARNADWRKRRFEHKHGDASSGGGDRSSRSPDAFRGQGGSARRDSWRDRPPSSAKGATSFPDRQGGPKRDWRDRPRSEAKPDAPGLRGGHGGPPRKDSWRDRPARDSRPFNAKGGTAANDRRGAPKDDWREQPRKDGWRGRPPTNAKSGTPFNERRGAPKGDWRDRPRGDTRTGAAFGGGGKGGKRPFTRSGFDRHRGSEEPTPREQRPKSPNREPRPGENPEPTPPPRPSEPAIAPPGPPERGRRKGPHKP